MIHLGDLREVVKAFRDNSFDSIVTDPPYELSFMNAQWDRSGVSHDVTGWTELYRVLRPGGYLIAFGGTRTAHRMVCAIEDAGFDIRDSIAWIYASGYPSGNVNVGNGRGTRLKPAHEPICVARKPFEGTLKEHYAASGLGAVDIDGCRIAMAPEDFAKLQKQVESVRAKGGSRGGSWANDSDLSGANPANPLGRWPANAIFDEACGAELDAQVTGGASRFFFCPKPSRSEKDAGLEHMPWVSSGDAARRKEGSAGIRNAAAGAGRTSPVKNNHPTVKPANLLRYLVRFATPPGGRVLDPFCGSGTTGVACVLEGMDFVGIDIEMSHVVLATQRINAARLRKGCTS